MIVFKPKTVSNLKDGILFHGIYFPVGRIKNGLSYDETLKIITSKMFSYKGSDIIGLYETRSISYFENSDINIYHDRIYIEMELR